jgi:hypothetical protein
MLGNTLINAIPTSGGIFYGLRLHAVDGDGGLTELSDIWYFPIHSGLFRGYVLGRRSYLALG